jgi:hypothetical protein
MEKGSVMLSENRRSFLRTSLLAGLSGVIWTALGQGPGLLTAARAASPQDGMSEKVKKLRQAGAVVAIGRLKDFSRETKLDEARAMKLVSETLCGLVGKSNVKDACQQLFAPNDIIGIKVNTLAGPNLSPRWPLLLALVECLNQAGLKKEQIIIWDRTSRELQRAGYTLATTPGQVQCYGTDAMPSGGYEPQIESSGSIGSCFSLILSRKITALINFGVLKDHDLCGVAVGMKNFYGVIHNPNKYHDNNCDPYIADLCNHPHIKDKLRLSLCDGLMAQYQGGPAYKPQFMWPSGTLLASLDPVALDAVGYDLIRRKRAELKLPSLIEIGKEPKYIQTAASRGLGEGDLTKIKLVENIVT